LHLINRDEKVNLPDYFTRLCGAGNISTVDWGRAWIQLPLSSRHGAAATGIATTAFLLATVRWEGILRRVYGGVDLLLDGSVGFRIVIRRLRACSSDAAPHAAVLRIDHGSPLALNADIAAFTAQVGAWNDFFARAERVRKSIRGVIERPGIRSSG
jgi:hypothetical protein